jgi:hypothetical protein
MAWARRRRYATLYARPGAIRAGFAQFAAFGQDVLDARPISPKASSTHLFRHFGGEAAFGAMMTTVMMRYVETDVQEAIVPDSGHGLWRRIPQQRPNSLPIS